jgi:hypothetical protein
MTTASRVRCVAAIAAALPLPAPIARAQPSDAEVLFGEGRTLMREGDVAGACAKFPASERLESRVGTLLNLGECREQHGQIAAAWECFRAAEALARRTEADGERAAEAKARADQLEPKLAPSLGGMAIRRDAPPPTIALPAPPDPASPSWFTTERKLSISIGAAGAAALGGGLAYALRSRDLARRADELCPETACGDPGGLDANADARRSATRANLLFATGGVAAVGAIVLWIAGAPVQASAGADHVEVSLEGRF